MIGLNLYILAWISRDQPTQLKQEVSIGECQFGGLVLFGSRGSTQEFCRSVTITRDRYVSAIGVQFYALYTSGKFKLLLVPNAFGTGPSTGRCTYNETRAINKRICLGSFRNYKSTVIPYSTGQADFSFSVPFTYFKIDFESLIDMPKCPAEHCIEANIGYI